MEIKTTYFIKIRKHSIEWESIESRPINFISREKAIEFCENLANFFHTEIRLSKNHPENSGTYIRPSII